MLLCAAAVFGILHSGAKPKTINYKLSRPSGIRWDARVAEWGSLENCCARKGTGGSTPPPTAAGFRDILVAAISGQIFVIS